MRIHEFSIYDQKQLENVRIHPVGRLFFPSIHQDLADLSAQLSDCFNMWSSYFALTQTRLHRLIGQCIFHGPKLDESHLPKHMEYLNDLRDTIHRLQNEHQKVIDGVLKHYRSRLNQGETPSSFIPYINNNEFDSIYLAVSAICYSTTELARAALALGTSIHTIFELETTHRYEQF
jgi:hypothetical protein